MSTEARVVTGIASAAVSARGRRVFHGLVLAVAAAVGSAPAGAEALERAIFLLSQNARGYAAEGRSVGPAVNADGTSATYTSNALDLVSPTMQVDRSQIYARDLDQVTSELVSKSPAGVPGNRPSQVGSFASSISGDGRFAAFSSQATNLVPEPTNGLENVFVYDRVAGTMELISRGVDGPADGASGFPRLSGDGRFVVFQSQARNLTADGDGPFTDIFLYDRTTGELRLVSASWNGEPTDGSSITPAISDDGRVVAFASRATNLVQEPMLSGAFEQIFVRDLAAGRTELVSVSSDERPANAISFLPDLTADGSQVAFKSEAFNLVPNDTNGWPDVFVRDRPAGTTQRVSVDDFGNESNGLSGAPGISGDGRFVAFISFASNFVPDDGNGFSDVYVYDRFPPGRGQGLIARVTVALDNDGEPNAGVSDFPVGVSRDGRWIAFASASSNLVPNDLNNDFDAFLACNPFDAFGCTTSLPTPTPTPTITPTGTPGVIPCVGDCSGDGEVTIDELIRMVNIALGIRSVCGEDGMGQCLAGDANCDCEITVEEIIQAVNNTLRGCMSFGSCTLPEHELMCCGGPFPTATATQGGATPTDTATPDTSPATPTPTVDGSTPTPTATEGGTPPTVTPTATVVSGTCVGDCGGDGEVDISDLIRMVNIALGLQPLCPDGGAGCLAGDAACDCAITVEDIVRGVNNTLHGCRDFVTCSPSEHQAMCCAG
ncbi:MAG: TolB family protein [Candidatus Binatia bacterium]